MVKSGVLAATVRDAALGFAAIAPTKPHHHYTRLYGGDGPPAPHLRGVAAAPSRLDGVRLGLFKAHAHDADQVRTHLRPEPNTEPNHAPNPEPNHAPNPNPDPEPNPNPNPNPCPNAHCAHQGAIDALTAGLEHLRSLGAEIVEIAIPNLHALSMAHGMKISTEFALG